jgi:hypothetical protein
MSDMESRDGRLGIPLGQLDIMLPLIRNIGEAVTPRDNVEEHEQAFLDADVGGELRCDVLHDPIRQLEEGLLIEVAEVIEAVRNGEQQADCSARTRAVDALHTGMRTRGRACAHGARMCMLERMWRWLACSRWLEMQASEVVR